ncbi:MAG: ATP-binding protein [Nitriliruptoraceae bacterium]
MVERPGGHSRAALFVVLTVVAYLVALTYALSVGRLAEIYGLIWPPAGVAVASLLLAPRRWWPALLATLFVTQVVYDLVRYDADLLPAALWAGANLLSYLIVPALVVRWQAGSLDTVGHVLRFTFAVLLGAVPAGLLGAWGAVLSGDPTPYAVTAALWASGVLVGVLMVVPVALLAAGKLPRSGRSPVEVAVILGVVLLVSVAVFALSDHGLAATIDYIVVLPVVLAALRLRLSGAVLAVTVATNVAVLGTALGRGPFGAAEWTPIESASLLRVFLVVVAVSALMVASRAQEGASSAGLAEQRERLLAAVSHELRTPLTPIVGFSQLLLRARPHLDRDARSWVEAIDRNGRHLTGLIDDLLLLSRVNRERLVVEPELLVLGDLVTQILEDRREVEVRLGGLDPDLRAWADPQHVRQVLDNLLQNALRHGQPPVVVDVESDGDWARLVVTDQGGGVPAALVDRLFDPFSQPEVGDRRPTQGLGLGLAICSALVASNGGTIGYGPVEPAGARFVVRLPRAVAEPSAPRSRTSPGSGPPQPV